ncbi:MAG: DUF6934 family protein [Saprospiraceae bacterium]
MTPEHYEFTQHNFQKLYIFQSIGKRTVVKAVQFSLERNGLYNLGLADFENGKLRFDQFTANDDAWKVLNTVAAITLNFSENRPEARILIRATEPKRQQLYNRIFQSRINLVQEAFEVEGILQYPQIVSVPFDPEKQYEGFILTRKIQET